MKISKFIKEKKVPIMIVSGVLLAGAAGGTYYLAKKQDGKFNKTTESSTQVTTDSQVQQNVETKADAAADSSAATTTPTVVAPAQPTVATLSDVSLSVLLDFDKTKAYTYLYGPAGTYGVEKLTNGSWTVITASYDYSGRGGYAFDTILQSDAQTHYRVFKLVSGARVATSGDTVINWQEILDKGTMSVPLGG